MAIDPLSVCRWLALPPAELLGACRQERYQGSGPGGQKRNRVYSGVRLVHPESGLSIEADARRESRRNLEDALHRLRLALAMSGVGDSTSHNKASRTDEETEASPAFRSPAFRANASPTHNDFPLFAFRALYFLNLHQGRASAAAQALGCTASALTRFFKTDKALWVKAKEIREAHGLHPLK